MEKTLKSRIAILMAKFKTTEHLFMIVIPIIIGLLGGLGAIVLRYLIHLFQGIMWGNETFTASWWQTLLIPAGGAFIVGVIIHYFSKEAKGHGVPEVMEAISLKNGVIRPRVVASKAIASALTIASGGSVGREGPIIQIGAAIGSTLGQMFKLSKRHMQTLVGCGAAAGIAAAFNAPIAGAMFSVEILLGDFTARKFSPIVISSVTATVISRMKYGDHPAFMIPKYELVHPIELIPYALLGLIAGAVGILFIKVLYYFEEKFDAVDIPDYWKTLAGGLLLGIVGLTCPQIFGVGYEAMNEALLGNMSMWLLFALIFVKILATSLTLGGGSSGGIFAPSLFMGAMTGGFFGNILHKFFPNVTAGPGAYALVAMSAVVAATTQAPITAILIIFEMSSDYKIILPLMIATIISLVVVRKQKGSIYTLKLMKKGIDIHGGKEINILKAMKVKDVMRNSIETVPANTTMKEMMEKFVSSEHSHFYITDPSGHITDKISQVELSTVAPVYETLKDFVVAADISTPNLLEVTEEHDLDSVMKEFGKENVGEIPVISSKDPNKVLGTVWRLDVITAYNKEILKRDLAGEVCQTIANSSMSKIVDVTDGLAMLEIDVPGDFIGRNIIELDIRNKFGVDIILIKKHENGKATHTHKPDAKYVFHHQDTLLILGEKDKVEYMNKL